jgi:hypothetical protein
MNGRLLKVVAMFNALDDASKRLVVPQLRFPEPTPEPHVPPSPLYPGFPPPPAEPLDAQEQT